MSEILDTFVVVRYNNRLEALIKCAVLDGDLRETPDAAFERWYDEQNEETRDERSEYSYDSIHEYDQYEEHLERTRRAALSGA